MCKKSKHIGEFTAITSRVYKTCNRCRERHKGVDLIAKRGSILSHYPNLCKEWNYKKNTKGPDAYTPGINIKLWWICSLGHEWGAKICHRRVGTGCPYCKGRKVCIGNSLLSTDDQEICKEWNYGKNEKTPGEYTRYSHAKVWWVCSKGHEWQTSISHRTGQKRGCPYCCNQKVGYGNSLAENDLLGVCEEWNYRKNTKGPESYTPGSNIHVWWVCKKGHEWQTKICMRTGPRQTNCPSCNESRGEKLVAKYLEDKGISFERQKRFVSLRRCSYDFFILDMLLVIEYDGQQHFDPNTFYARGSRFSKIKERDLKKIRYAARKGLSIFRLSYCSKNSVNKTLNCLFQLYYLGECRQSFIFKSSISNPKVKDIYQEQKDAFLKEAH